MRQERVGICVYSRLLCHSVVAQEPTEADRVAERAYVRDQFTKNWYVELGVGAQLLFADDASTHGSPLRCRCRQVSGFRPIGGCACRRKASATTAAPCDQAAWNRAVVVTVIEPQPPKGPFYPRCRDAACRVIQPQRDFILTAESAKSAKDFKVNGRQLAVYLAA